MLWSIFGGIIIGAGGVFLFLKPELYWKLTEEWKAYSASGPSDLYLKSTRVGGAFLVLFGIVMIVLSLIIE